MLTHLRIENFALIDSLELDFSGGLNVLTGETGAGKSIILDALDAVLGGKVSGNAVRTGTQRALIEATFASNETLNAWLTAQEIDHLEEGIVITREVSGKSSRSRINGVLVNQALLRTLREPLLEITAQGQSLQLEKSEVQLELLDSFAGAAPLRDKVQKAYESAQKRKAALARKKAEQAEKAQQLDLFKFQYEELSKAELDDPLEEEQLTADFSRLAHASELQQSSQKLYAMLYEGDRDTPAVTDILGQANEILLQMSGYDPSLESLSELLEGALIQVQECARAVNRYGDTVESDPEQLDFTEKRLRLFKTLKQKYGSTLAEVITYFKKLQKDLRTIEGGDENLEAEEKLLAGEIVRATELADQLTRVRTEAATRLQSALIQELKPLGMAKVRFAVQLEPTRLGATGVDQVQFLWSPNPGEPLHPLTETASGGEMARFLLALKACLGAADHIGTLVFDEIDIGVSGRVAQAVADKLLQLGQFHQVLCVTHQPLVAAMADSHYRVQKHVRQEEQGERTVVHVEKLSQLEARCEELAQLAVGKTAREALDFASSLLTEANRRRATL
ncbi:MAG: DNA repair protein RecN [Anaerolineae bacterium]|nr:DNA repair protein RecN [Gloeobacterales cyanobacterium ES-bin-313]